MKKAYVAIIGVLIGAVILLTAMRVLKLPNINDYYPDGMTPQEYNQWIAGYIEKCRKRENAARTNHSFEDLLDAIEWVESKGDPNAKGDWTEWEQVKYIDYLRMETRCEYELRWNRQCDYSTWYSRKAKAIGAYQIREIYVDDVNKILRGWKQQIGEQIKAGGVKGLGGWFIPYTYEDRWNRDYSRDMVEVYLTYYNPSSAENEFEAMARIHNGGPDGRKKESTKEYWEKVKSKLERTEL